MCPSNFWPPWSYLLPGSFLNCTPSLSRFWGTKSSLMQCQGSRIATWREEGAERWIMPRASAWAQATEHCPRLISSLNVVDVPLCARRYTAWNDMIVLFNFFWKIIDLLMVFFVCFCRCWMTLGCHFLLGQRTPPLLVQRKLPMKNSFTGARMKDLRCVQLLCYRLENDVQSDINFELNWFIISDF